ncbi:MAG: resuscitation-promoting factor RpfE [Solirubrobacteraceae bacterium]|jgi:hypothetical protein|nr:resuscitation-promoting factor RpfE [Solirubrobacteraceae bacterium]
MAVALVAAAALIPALAFAADAATTNADPSAVPDSALAVKPEPLRSVAKRKARAARAIAKRQERRRRARERAARERKQAAAAQSSASPALEAIAACESGGDPHAIGGGGAYRGKYQFDYGTWASVGGSGDPAAASEAEQDRRAAMLYARSGNTPWPVCGQ